MAKFLYPLSLVTVITSALVMLLFGKNVAPNTENKILPSFLISNVYKVEQITGAGSLNATAANYNVYGTDLGIIWDNGRNQVMVAFGDTYGAGWSGCGAGPDQAAWRSNVLALSSNADPKSGLLFSGMPGSQNGQATELIASGKKDGTEITKIPTAGVSVGSRNFIYFMSVKNWVSPGKWNTNYAGLAYSDDNGQSWTIDPKASWLNNQPGGNDKFQQTAAVKNSNYIYLFGTPNGRFGPVYLARVKEEFILYKTSYEYWDGLGWQLDNEEAAVAVANGPAGELSVQYNSHFNRWLMTYLDESRGAIVLRDAPSLTGPWSEPQTLVSSVDYPQLYGAFIHPWFNQGTDLYFNMSQWCSSDTSYNVSFMHASLNLAPQPSNANIWQPVPATPLRNQNPSSTKLFIPWSSLWKQPAQGDDFTALSYPAPLDKMNGQVYQGATT